MLKSITSSTINALKLTAQPANNAAHTRLLNQFVMPRMLHSMQLLHPSGMNVSQKRGVVTMRAAQAMNQHLANVNQNIGEHFSFQKPNQSQSNTETIQKKMIAAFSEHAANPDNVNDAHQSHNMPTTQKRNLVRTSPNRLSPQLPNMQGDKMMRNSVQHHFISKENPHSADVEQLVNKHGPVRLTLYGLLGQREGGAGHIPTDHTVLVMGVSQHQGYRYALIVDGNDKANNVIKSEAESYALQHNKPLSELDAQDFGIINQGLGKRQDSSQAMYRLINLDRVMDNHDATVKNYQKYLGRMQQDLESEGLSYPVECFSVKASQLVYDDASKVNGAMSQSQKQVIADILQDDPAAVESFIPMQGAGANTDLFVQLPALEKIFYAPSAALPWSPLKNVEELKSALHSEPTFREALDQPENQQWINTLFEKINAKPMPEEHRGIEMIMRFKCTYGTVHHLAITSMWRDQEGKLQLGVHHQEAVPMKDKNWEGHVFSTFDTVSEYPKGAASPVKSSPVAESIKLAGMPDVNVLTTKAPDKLPSIAQAMSGHDNAFPYGAHESWRDSKWRFESTGRPFITCSNTTLDTHDMMAGRRPEYKATLPDLFKEGRLGELNNTSFEKIRKIKVAGTDYDMNDIVQLPSTIADSIFAIGGMQWGNHKPWDVKAPRDVQKGAFVLPVGDGVALPQDKFPESVKGAVFLNPKKGLITSDGKQVERNVFYERSDIAGMTYSWSDEQQNKAGRPLKLDFITSSVSKMNNGVNE